MICVFRLLHVFVDGGKSRKVLTGHAPADETQRSCEIQGRVNDIALLSFTFETNAPLFIDLEKRFRANEVEWNSLYF